MVPDLQRRHAFVREHEVQAVLPRRKAVGRRELIVATARRRVQRPRDREADTGRVRLPDHEPAIGGSVGKGDVARVVAFIVSPAADYVTGQLLYVDGGINARMGLAWEDAEPRR